MKKVIIIKKDGESLGTFATAEEALGYLSYKFKFEIVNVEKAD
jgi:hypothetical protein